MKRMAVPVLILAVLLSACGEVGPVPTTELPVASPTQELGLPVATKTQLLATQPPAPTEVVPPIKAHPTVTRSLMTPRPQSTPHRLEDSPAFQPVRTYIAQMQKVTPDQVIATAHEPTIWPDSCLGLAAPGEACAMIETPGYLVFFDTPNGQVEAHLDRSGRNYRLAPLSTP